MSKFKIGLTAILLVWMLAPSAVLAADTLPQFNPLCWQPGGPDTKEADKPFSCYDERKKWFTLTGFIGGNNPNEEAKDGWVEAAECAGAQDASGNEVKWGKCLPPGKTVASIALGGQRIFYNIGDYIKTGYKIAISIASILAAVVIIISGLQWTASGGNTEVISSAKKRIGGAVIGLTLAFGSYLILNTINPALVNLRLPQTYMIRQIQMPAYWCNEFIDPTRFSGSDSWIKRFAEAGLSSAAIDKAKYNDLKDEHFAYSYTESVGGPIKGKPICSMQYFPQGGGGNTCFGDSCVNDPKCSGEECICFPPLEEEQKEYGCEQGRLGGTLRGSYFFTPACYNSAAISGWAFPWADKVELVAIKKDGTEVSVASVEPHEIENKKIQAFLINFDNADINATDIKGYALKLDLNSPCDTTKEVVKISSGILSGLSPGTGVIVNGMTIYLIGNNDPPVRYVDRKGLVIDPKNVADSRLFSATELKQKTAKFINIDVAYISPGK